MKRIAILIAAVACTPAFAQVFNNPSTVTPFAQVQANGVLIDNIAGADFAQRVASDRCIYVREVDNKPKYYLPPQPGHNLPFSADDYIGKLSNGWGLYADTFVPQMRKPLWSDTGLKTSQIASGSNLTQKIASSSSSSSSSSSATVRSWSENGKTTTESSAESEVTVNGKTYRTYKHELNTTPQPVEPESYNGTVYYCR